MIKPGLKIVYSKGIDIDKIQELIYGIEEEGILYQITVSEFEKIEKEKYTNGKSEIGIAINLNGEIILNQKKYTKKFILKENINSSKENLRTFGQNSARILKGLPLKF